MYVFSCYLLLTLELCLYLRMSLGDFPCYFAKDECPNEDVQFWYYNKDSPDTPLLIDVLNLTRETIRSSNTLEVLIHGFTLDKDGTPNRELRSLLLQQVQADVISVDYNQLAQLPCFYPWAVANTKVVAKCLGLLLNNLVHQGVYSADMIHLIGFSLGAQIAGLTANHLDFKLRKITGLDPAAIGFRTNDSKDKLDPSDANFVDIVHTDPHFFSDIARMGQADFYPNPGALFQPGCSSTEEPLICSHYRAAAYYAESITTDIGFWSYNCGNHWYYFLKQCHLFAELQPVKMGFYVSESANGSYFLETNSQPPYAKPVAESDLTVADVISNEAEN